MHARTSDAATAGIQLSKIFIHEFLIYCLEMDGRYQDFGTDGQPYRISRPDGKSLPALDKETLSVWFWGRWGVR